jgi:hypothetical protein
MQGKILSSATKRALLQKPRGTLAPLAATQHWNARAP